MSGVIPAVILAAGLSSRMGGRAKALLPLADGRTFIDTIITSFAAAGVDDIVVVGHEAGAVTDHVASRAPQVRCVRNDDYRQGQFSSLIAGLDAIDRPGVSGMLLTLVDVPRVSPSTIAAVLQRYRAVAPPIVRPVRGAEHGHPVLIDRALFSALRDADPAQGAKPVVRAHVSAAGDVPVDDDWSFRDVDTPDDHARARGNG